MTDALVAEYLEEVRRVVGGSRRKRRRLVRELHDHVTDAVEAGGGGEAAARAAVRRLGAPAEIAAGTATRSWARPPVIEVPSLDHVVETRINCSGAVHTVRLVAGSLVPAAHDLHAEEALVALGSPVPACLDVVRAWRQPLDDALGLVPVWLDPSAPRADLRAERGARDSTPARIFSSRFPELDGGTGSYRRWRRVVISSLPYEFRSAYTAGVLRAAERRVSTDNTRTDELERVAHAVFLQAVRRVSAGPVPTRVRFTALHSQPKVIAERDVLTVIVSLTWPRLVAAAGLGVIAGRLVLAAGEPDGAQRKLTLLDWQRTRRGMQPIARPAIAVTPASQPARLTRG